MTLKTADFIKQLDAQQPGWERTFAHPSDVQSALSGLAGGMQKAPEAIKQWLKNVTAPRLWSVGRAYFETVRQHDSFLWRELIEAAGHWQDGSQTDVALLQDDATCQCIIKIGTDDPKRQRFAKRYYGATFEAAMAAYLREQATKGEPK